MDNRFGIKDFFLFILLSGVAILIILAMFQYDRQWNEIRAIHDKLEDQSKELRYLSEKIEKGGIVGTNPTTQQTLAAADDPFYRLRSVENLPNFSRGDWVISALMGKSSTLTPLVSGDAYAADLQSLVLESLVQRDPETLEWKPLLATSWTVEDHTKEYDEYTKAHPSTQPTTQPEGSDARPFDPNAPYPVVIHFKIRQGVRFSDGEPLSADDVVFTYNFTMNEKINAPRERAYFEKIAKVVKEGENGVVFYYKEPYFNAFSLAGGLQVLPKHFYEKFEAEKFNASTGLLLGSGPYRLESPTGWTPDKPMEVIRNERYWGITPPVDRIIWRVIENGIARLTSFKNGEIDEYEAETEAYDKIKNDPALAAKSNRFEYFYPSGGYRYIAWNQQRNGAATPFADKRVRRAFAMLVDRNQLKDIITHGYSQLATGPFSPLSNQYDKSVQPIAFDVEQGKKLLAEAGYSDRNNDGIIDGPDGRPFKFKLTYPTSRKNYETQTLFIKDALGKAGIIVDPDPLEWSVFKERLEQKNYDAITLAWGTSLESDIFQMFHSSQMIAGGDNFMSYKNPELDDLLVKARTTIDETKRIELWHRCHQILNEDQPYMFLWFPKKLMFVDKRFQNVRQMLTGLSPETEWYVPKAEQRWTK